MGLVRFMTVYDDESDDVLTLNNCKLLDISAPSAFFKSDGHSYLDNFNANSYDLTKIMGVGAEYTEPTIPASVFQYSLSKVRDNGYLAAFVICPHGKWMPYYKSAVHAAKNISRTAKRHNDDYFNIHVVNSKAFGIGSVLMANRMALDFYHNRNSTKIISDYSVRYAKSSTTYILTANNTIFGNANDLTAYRITDTRVFPVDISNSVESVKFDRFAEIVGRAIIRSHGRYAVSVGSDCVFAANVIGRIERDFKCIPLVWARYGIATTQILGNKTLCFHLGEYI